MFLNTPCNSAAILSQNYNIDMCTPLHYNHKYETIVLTLDNTLPCEKLHQEIAFVHREITGNLIRETLQLMGWKIHQFVVNGCAS